MDEGAHPAGLDALVDRVDGHEASRVRSRRPVAAGRLLLDYLDALRRQLQAVAALDLARDHDPGLGNEAAEHPAASPHGRRDVARAVVELGGEPGSAAAHRPSDGLGAHYPGHDRGLLADAQVGDLLDVREILVARGEVRDHVGERPHTEVPEGGLYPRSDTGQLRYGPAPELGEGRAFRGDRAAGTVRDGPRHTPPGRRVSRRRPRSRPRASPRRRVPPQAQRALRGRRCARSTAGCRHSPPA